MQHTVMNEEKAKAMFAKARSNRGRRLNDDAQAAVDDLLAGKSITYPITEATQLSVRRMFYSQAKKAGRGIQTVVEGNEMGVRFTEPEKVQKRAEKQAPKTLS